MMSIKETTIAKLNTQINDREYQLDMLKLAIAKEKIGSELLFSFRRLCEDVSQDITDLKDKLEDANLYL